MRKLFFVSTLLLLSEAHADPARDALTDIMKCADIVESAKRLECFDAATTRARSALAAPPPAAKEKSFMDYFGFAKSMPVTKPEDFGKSAPEPDPAEVTQVSSDVLEFAKTARGKAVFILENGQVWRQIDGDTTDVYAPAPGTRMKVVIEVGFLNSYNLTVVGRKGLIKVARLK